jgi:hypothetical protein
MFEKPKCYDTQTNRTDTAGNPIKIRVCYCGTTACTNLSNNNYPLPNDYNVMEICEIDKPCKDCGVPKLYQNKDCKNH